MEAAGAPRGRPAQRLSGAVRSPQLWGKENADPWPQVPAEKLLEDPCAKQECKSEAQFEAAIASGAGDIVQVWCDYVQFAGGSMEVLQRACTTLASDPRHGGDVRHLRLWVTSARDVDRPQETFEALERSGIGLEHALLYEAWAASLERARLFDQAGAVYERGIEASARPLERLRNRFKEFQGRMRKRAERDAMRARRCAAPASSPPLPSSPANSGTPSASPAQDSLRALSPSPAASASRSLVLHWGELPASNWQVDLPPVAPDSPEAPEAGSCHPSASSRSPPDVGSPRASPAPQEPLASPDSAAEDGLAGDRPSASSRHAASRGSPRASQEPLTSPDSEVDGPVGGHLLGSEPALDGGSPRASLAPSVGSLELTASSWMASSALGATSLGLSASVSRPSCTALDTARSVPPAATPSSLASSPTLQDNMPLLQRWARAHAPGLLNQSSGSGFETPQHTCYFQTPRHSDVEADAPHTPEPVARSRSPSPPGAELADAAIAGDVGDDAVVAAEQLCQSAGDAQINEDSESQHAAALAALATKWAPSAAKQPTAKIEPRKSKWAAVPVADSHKTWHRNGGALSGAPLLWRRRNSDPKERIGQGGDDPASELPSISELHGTDMDGGATAVSGELPSSSELQRAKEPARRRVSSEKFRPPRWSAVRRLSGQDVDEEEEAEMPQWSALRLPVSRPMAPEQFASPLPAAAPHLLSPAAPETNDERRGREAAPAPASPPPRRPACSPSPSPSGDEIAVAPPSLSPSPSPPQERAGRPRLEEDVSVEEVRAAAVLAQLPDSAAPQVAAA